MKFTKFLIVLFLLQLYHFQCGDGCLKCNTRDQCQICDTTTHYYLTSGRCIKTDLENCLLISMQGTCIQCQPKYYFDNETKKCIVLPETFIIENCEYYITQSTCIKCIQGFFLQSNRCQQLETIVENCEIGLSSNTCFKCKDGYKLNLDNTQCLETTKASNCLDFTALSCRKCVEHSLKYPDYYISLLTQDKNLGESTLSLLIQEKTNFTNEVSINTCRSFTVTNCQSYESFDKCKICDSGYYLDGVECIGFPKSQITNCKIYSDYVTCTECKPGFHLTKDHICVENEGILNCAIYDSQSIDQTSCIECESNYFLQQNICEERDIQPIENCKELKINDQLCDVCQDGYAILGQGNKCLPEITNCGQYTNTDPEKLICAQCSSGYFLNDTGTCSLGTKANCLNYELDKDNCIECIEGFYLDVDTCLQHRKIENCINYHKSSKNVCIRCESESIPFNQKNVCTEATEITGCAVYENKTTCKECQEGYYHNQSICVVIDQGLNCKVYDPVESKCTKCNQNVILKNGKCLVAPRTVVEYCEKINFAAGNIQFSQMNCEQCSTNAIPIDVSDKFTCFEKSMMTDYFTLQNSVNILNCEKYEIIIDTNPTPQEYYISCQKCQDGYLLNFIDNKYQTCTKQCLETDNKAINLLNKSCQNSNIPGCAQFKGLACYECKSGYFKVVDRIPTAVEYLNLLDNSTLQEINPSVVNKYSEVQCVSDQSKNFFGETISQQKVANCEFYNYKTGFSEGNFNGNIYYCIKCKNGFNGKMRAQDGPDDMQIYQCYEDSECGVTYTPGLRDDHINIVSCFQCENGKMVNFKNDGEKRFECEEQSKDQCMVAIDDDCKVCAKGYYPDEDDDCREISQCVQSEWVNNCSLCQSDSAFKKVLNQNVDYTECFPSPTDNCKIFIIDGTEKCIQCRDGYFINRKGDCEQMIFPKCDLINTEGCDKCQQNYIPLLMKDNDMINNICIYSEFLEIEKYTNEDGFIQNCENYSIQSDTLNCVKCKSGFVVKSNREECFPDTELPYCEIATLQNNCQLCIEGFIAVEEICQKKNIENCVEYEKVATLKEQICNKCKDGFYLNEKKCLEGEVLNCQVYKFSAKDCISCQQGYQLVNNQSNESYCYPISSDFNCDSLQSDQFQLQQFECQTCSLSNSFYLDNNTEETSFCLRFSDIENCQSLDYDNALDNSTFGCKECKDGYYSKNGICKVRVNTHSSCKEYQFDKDECKVCNPGYFLSVNKDDCIGYPNGIQNCLLYSSADDCEGCIAGFYLKESECVKVETIISNCLLYQTENTCKTCDTGYFLVNNECQQMEAQDCETYESVNACATCPDGKGLKESGNTTNCVSNEDQKCIDFSNRYPFECYKCDVGYYLNSSTGVCEAVENIIENCLYYESISKCLQCNKGYVLTLNKRCIELEDDIDDLCIDYFENSTPECQYCIGGHYLDSNNSCQKCNVSNCYFCTSYQPDICLLCQSGYYMNQEQQCIKGSIIIDDTNEEVEEIENSKLLKLIGLILIIFQIKGQFLIKNVIKYNNDFFPYFKLQVRVERRMFNQQNCKCYINSK